MSDIFNDYARIAVDQGLIKEAEVGDESNPRFDSITEDDIRALYGVKPNGEEKHIVEQAHPESVVVSPAYDKMNGLVENVIERQNIMQWIATKPNDGKHTNERYVKASKDLTMALLNTAFMLDRTDNKDLMKLADDCANRMTKEGIAFVPLMFYLGAAGISSMAIINNFGGMIDNGVLSNSDRAIEELKDLISDNEMPGKEEDIQNLIRDIQYVKQLNEELTSFNVSSNQSESQLKSDVESGKGLLRKYIKGVRHLNTRISHVLGMAEAQAQEQAGSSWLAQNIGDLGIGLEKIWSSLWGDDIRDVLVILDTLKESLSKSVASMTKLYNSVKSKAESGEHQSLEELLKIKVEEQEELPFEAEEAAAQ